MSNQAKSMKSKVNNLYENSGLKVMRSVCGTKITLAFVAALLIPIYLPITIIIQLAVGVN